MNRFQTSITRTAVSLLTTTILLSGIGTLIPSAQAAPQTPLQMPSVFENRPSTLIWSDYYGLLGYQMLMRGQVLAAERLLVKAVSLDPRNAELHLSLGTALEALEKNRDAIQSYQKAAELRPGWLPPIYNLALLVDKSGDTKTGIQYLSQALAMEPSNPWLNYDMGVFHARINDYAQSAEYTRKAIELNPDQAEFYNNYGYALAQIGQYAQAVEMIQKSLAMKPDSAPTLDSLGFAYQGMKRYDQALAEYNKALAIDASIVEIHLHKAQLLEDMGRFVEALESYKTYISLTPNATDRAQIETKIKHLSAIAPFGTQSAAGFQDNRQTISNPYTDDAYGMMDDTPTTPTEAPDASATPEDPNQAKENSTARTGPSSRSPIEPRVEIKPRESVQPRL
jgi:tetratricopeptide (TPR) repeat protein